MWKRESVEPLFSTPPSPTTNPRWLTREAGPKRPTVQEDGRTGRLDVMTTSLNRGRTEFRLTRTDVPNFQGNCKPVMNGPGVGVDDQTLPRFLWVIYYWQFFFFFHRTFLKRSTVLFIRITRCTYRSGLTIRISEGRTSTVRTAGRHFSVITVWETDSSREVRDGGGDYEKVDQRQGTRGLVCEESVQRVK